MEDHRLPLLAKPPPSQSRCLNTTISSVLFLCLLLLFLFAQLHLLRPSFTGRFLLEPPAIATIQDISCNPDNFTIDGKDRPNDLQRYHLTANLIIPYPGGDNLSLDARPDYSTRSCVYYKKECISSYATPVYFKDHTLNVNALFDMDEGDVRGEAAEMGILRFDLRVEGAYTVSKHGSNWFGKIRVLRVECKGLKTVLDPSGRRWIRDRWWRGLKRSCEVQTWPVMTCTLCEICRGWLLSVFKVTRGRLT